MPASELLLMPDFDHVVEPRTAGRPLAPARFANGELVIRLPQPVAGRSCILVGSATPPETRLATLLLAADTLKRDGAAHLTAVLPYLAYARQDRREPGVSLACAWLGELLHASGVDALVTVDIHSDAAAQLLGMPVTSLSPARLLASTLDADDTTTVVAPDRGARARAAELAGALRCGPDVAWVEKRRTPDGVAHTALHGELGAHAVVVDDILDTGATLVSCCRELRRRGVATIDIAVTHGLFTGERWRELLGLARTIHVTDTVPEARAHSSSRVLVHRVAPLLALPSTALRRTTDAAHAAG